MTTASYIALFVIGFVVLTAMTIGTIVIFKKAPEGSSTQYRSMGFLAACGMFWIIAVGFLIWFIKSPH
jgi:hypothetical protein